MSDAITEPALAAAEPDDRLVVDGNYLRSQASEAVTIFLAPMSGIFRVISGKNQIRAARKRKQAA